MKTILKVSGLVALVAITGVVFAACPMSRRSSQFYVKTEFLTSLSIRK